MQERGGKVEKIYQSALLYRTLDLGQGVKSMLALLARYLQTAVR